MGVYLNVRSVDVYIKKENQDKCLQALKDAQPEEGCNWDWIPREGILNAKTLKEALDLCHWHPVTTLKHPNLGDIITLEYIGEKLGSEDRIFETIAPYVESGSYIEAEAEDNIFRWDFDNGVCNVVLAELDWDQNNKIVEALLTHKEILPTLIGIHPKLDNKIAAALKGD